MRNDVILTGLRSNNDLTLGNYLGAIKPMIEMQKKYSEKYHINMFVPDLHSFTTPVDHSRLYNSSIHNLKAFVASGLDITNENTFIYRQSFIPAHSELTVILNCFTYIGELQRMTQFKEKGKNLNVSVGLFDYPVLMAADILLYDAKYVPVGEDQTQHVELARDIAIRFNNKFGDTFIPPEPEKKQIEFINNQKRLRIKDLVNPTKKMSKSDESEKGVIFLNDDPEIAYKKIMSATTDSFGEIKYDIKERPGISNLMEIYSGISGISIENVKNNFEGHSSYGDFKKEVASVIKNFLLDFQIKLNSVNYKLLQEKMISSEKIINKIANTKLYEVQKVVGLRIDTDENQS